jgi:DNA-binding NarL/FixJ family response regulator
VLNRDSINARPFTAKRSSIVVVSEVRVTREILAHYLANCGVPVRACALVDLENVLSSYNSPALIIVDGNTIGAEGFRVQLTDANFVAVCGLSEHDEKSMMFWLQAGARVFSPRDITAFRLRCAVVDFLRGDSSVALQSVDFAGRLSAGRASDRHYTERLTRLEREILDLMRRGRTNKEICRILGIRLSTAKNHVHSILHKTGASSRHELSSLVLE